jgi:hypothetical protein
LIDHLGSYIFNGPDGPSIDQHLVLGVSLGGHAAWQVFFNEPRVTAAVVIIGCPDYMRKFVLLYCITKLHFCSVSGGKSKDMQKCVGAISQIIESISSSESFKCFPAQDRNILNAFFLKFRFISSLPFVNIYLKIRVDTMNLTDTNQVS